MSTLNKIKTKLERYPDLSYKVENNGIIISPCLESGFSVWLKISEEKFTVGFDGWYEDFNNEEEALNCFSFGLSDECRLKVVKHGNTDCSWIVESKKDGQWNKESETGLIFKPFWKRKSIEYRQNKLIVNSNS